MPARVRSATTIGLSAHMVEVEVDVSFGLVGFHIVGLPDTAIKESSKRILTALKNCGIPLPAKKITVNLAPADLKKVGTLFDLPIAIAVLIAMKTVQLPDEIKNATILCGELSLDGSIRPVRGILSIVSDMSQAGICNFILPHANSAEAGLIENTTIIGISHLTELIAHLRGEKTVLPITPTPFCSAHHNNTPLSLADVKGQEVAKRAIQIAAAGGHNILLIGSPGSGKSMLARRLATLLPPLTKHEAIEITKVYSIAGKLPHNTLITERPFRSPHHTISSAGLIGGGTYPKPGEVSFAHRGILFLDELTEFRKEIIELIRQPLEEHKIHIVRAQQSVVFPAATQLIAALNPCPCGFYGDPRKNCSCTPQQIHRYLGKISGPLLDRIDLQIYVHPVTYEALVEKWNSNNNNNENMRIHTTIAARNKQLQRLSTHNTIPRTNSTLTPHEIQSCVMSTDAQQLLKQAFEKLSMTARGYHKTIKVARTIADLSNHDSIEHSDIQEALLYRSLDAHFEKHR